MENERLTGSAFGSLLRSHRLAAGLSQEDLAEKARMSARGIGALERGDRLYPYRETVVLLAKALGLTATATAEFQAAAARPRKPRPAISASASAQGLRPTTAPANNLPLALTSFIGREMEIGEITALLGNHRLVTLTGSGGVGKTRTAIQVAASTVEGSIEAAWFIEFAPLSSGDYLPTTIAQAVGITLGTSGDPFDQLVAALKPKNMLLVLDNCEHLIDATAKFAAALIGACPRITLLATSRQRLGIAGEATYRMPSLPVPPAAAAFASGDVRADAALSFAAVALFVERARAINNRFALSDENAPYVTDVCRRLDGIALAIELAAARANILSPRELRDRLGERFRVLTSGGRDQLPRHQTLRALIDWSHDLLDLREQRLFRRLGIFVNGFTLETASAVAGGDELDVIDVFDLVASLVDKSLVMADPDGDSVRFHLLESTRVYAVEKLATAGEGEALASRHLRYFRERFVELRCDYEQLRAGLEAAFATELDNVRAALDGALVRREISEGARLLAAIGNSWHYFWLHREGIARCEAFLAELPRSEPGLLSDLGASRSSLLGDAGQWTQAREAAVTAIAYARASGNGQLLASALKEYADALIFFRPDFAAADRALDEAQAIEDVTPHLRLRVLERRARVSSKTGDLDSAARAFTQVREESRLAGWRPVEAMTTGELAFIEFRRGHYSRATNLWHQALSLARNCEMNTERYGYLVCLGAALVVSGAIEAAVGPAIETIDLLARDPNNASMMRAIELLAYVAVAKGDLDRSARLAGYADAFLARIEYVRSYMAVAVYERLTTRLHEHLEPDELVRLTTEGASLSLEAAIALARTLNTSADDRHPTHYAAEAPGADAAHERKIDEPYRLVDQRPGRKIARRKNENSRRERPPSA